MVSPKKFSTFDEQIELLKSEKHLIITDETYAKGILMRIGYFPLFGGYKHLFRIPLTKKYKAGTTFNEIVALYEFDSNLRELFIWSSITPEDELLERMGFPQNWKKISRYRLTP